MGSSETVTAGQAGPMLPQSAVDDILQAIASDLYTARQLLNNAKDVTYEMAGAIAIIEKAGALADEAAQAYGSLGVATSHEWVFGDRIVTAISALAAKSADRDEGGA